jgi:hypothetical protein
MTHVLAGTTGGRGGRPVEGLHGIFTPLRGAVHIPTVECVP